MIEKLASCLTDLDLLAPYPAPVCLVLTAFSSAAVPSPHWSFRGIFCSACGSSQYCLTAAIPASAAFQAPMLCQLHLTRRCIGVKEILAVVKQLKQLQRKSRTNYEAPCTYVRTYVCMYVCMYVHTAVCKHFEP